MTARLFEISPEHFAHASGALWLPGSKTVLIADAHLGYGWAQRRRGELGPVRDHLAQQKIADLIDELSPTEAVFLGDLVHAPRPGKLERDLIETVLRSLAERVRLTFVRGNHDRGFERDFAALEIPLVEQWRRGGTVALHGDRIHRDSAACIVLGHLHPSLPIEDAAGVWQRIPVFLTAPGILILPAFSPFAAGFNLMQGFPAELAGALPREMNAIAATGKRVVPLGPIRDGRLVRRPRV